MKKIISVSLILTLIISMLSVMSVSAATTQQKKATINGKIVNVGDVVPVLVKAKFDKTLTTMQGRVVYSNDGLELQEEVTFNETLENAGLVFNLHDKKSIKGSDVLSYNLVVLNKNAVDLTKETVILEAKFKVLAEGNYTVENQFVRVDDVDYQKIVYLGNNFRDFTNKVQVVYTSEGIFYYVPPKSDVDAGYSFVVCAKDSKGDNAYFDLKATDKTYNGNKIYKAEMNDKEIEDISKLIIQSYKGTKWVTQFTATTDTTVSALDNKLYDRTTKVICDYTSDSEKPLEKAKFYYVPAKADLDAGYSFVVCVKDSNGVNTYFDLKTTDKTYNKNTIYTADISNEGISDISKLIIQSYSGSKWITQFTATSGTTVSKLDNKMYDRTTKVLGDYTSDSDKPVSKATFYYVPAKSDVDAGYSFKVCLKDSNGVNTYFDLEATDKTKDGDKIYVATINDENILDISKLLIQSYSGTKWITQFTATTNTTISALDDNMYLKEKKTLLDHYVDDDGSWGYVDQDSIVINPDDDFWKE